MNNNDMFKGVWPALFTPVKDGVSPSFGELEKLVESLIQEGVDGLYILGSTGQGIQFNQKQRMEAAEKVIDVTAGRVPVMVQVGSLTTHEAISLAEHAAVAGATSISSVGPIYFPGGPEMAIKHYKEIAESTNLPFFPYLLNQANDLSLDTMEKFIDKLMEIPQFVGMKLTTTDLLKISAIHNYAKDRVVLFSGADELMCQAALSGTVGAIGTMYNFWYTSCARAREAFVRGDFEYGKQFMLEFQKIIFEFLPNPWTFFREAVKIKHHVDIGVPVAPVGNGNKEWTTKEVVAMNERLESVSSTIDIN